MQYTEFFRTTQAAQRALDERTSDLRLRYRKAREQLLQLVAEGAPVPDNAAPRLERLAAAPASTEHLTEDLLRVFLEDIRALARLGKVVRWM